MFDQASHCAGPVECVRGRQRERAGANCNPDPKGPLSVVISWGAVFYLRAGAVGYIYM